MSNFLERHFPSTNIPEHNLVLDPGHVEEAINFMARSGRINLSGLKFEAEPHQEEVSSGDDVRNNNNTEDHHHPDTLFDIAIFELPSSCSSRNCVLSEVGIGRMEEQDGDGRPFLNLCHDGRLLIDGIIFKGHHLQIKVPARGGMRKHLEGKKKLDVKNGGRYYEVILANCNEEGRSVNVEGQVVFEFLVENDAPSRLQSLDLPDKQYLLVSVSTFLLLLMCCFRVRCSPRRSSLYEAAMQDGVDVEMSGGQAV
jgi:hypothetical protein